MKHSFKHFNGATIEVDEFGKKRVFYDDLEFKSIAAVNRYIRDREQVIKKQKEKNLNKYYSDQFLKQKSK